jgi:hypothetical protein
MKEPNMKRRALFTPAALLLAAIAGGTPAQSVDALVPIAGIVSGQPESVAFSGQAQIRSRLAPDPDFGSPTFVLTIDLSGVSGVGSSTKAKYVVSTQAIVQRRVAGSHRLEVTFPFMKSDSTDLTSARSAVASFAVDFDVNTGAVTGATGNVGSLSF